MKSEYMITQAVTLSSPVSTLYAWHTWTVTPPPPPPPLLATNNGGGGLPFYDSGFPTEARVKTREVRIWCAGYIGNIFCTREVLGWVTGGAKAVFKLGISQSGSYVPHDILNCIISKRSGSNYDIETLKN